MQFHLLLNSGLPTADNVKKYIIKSICIRILVKTDFKKNCWKQDLTSFAAIYFWHLYNIVGQNEFCISFLDMDKTDSETVLALDKTSSATVLIFWSHF